MNDKQKFFILLGLFAVSLLLLYSAHHNMGANFINSL